MAMAFTKVKEDDVQSKQNDKKLQQSMGSFNTQTSTHFLKVPSPSLQRSALFGRKREIVKAILLIAMQRGWRHMRIHHRLLQKHVIEIGRVIQSLDARLVRSLNLLVVQFLPINRFEKRSLLNILKIIGS